MLKFLGNVAKGAANFLGFDTSGFENDEQEKFQSEQAQLNRDFQKEMLQKQMDYNTEMWHQTNEYNSAKEQVRRYEEAGLNPYLMMTGGANAGTASNVTSPSPSGGSSPSGGGSRSGQVGGINQLINTLTQREMSEKQMDILDQEYRIKKSEADYSRVLAMETLRGLGYDNDIKSIESKWRDDLLGAGYREYNKRIENIAADTRLKTANSIMQELVNENYPEQFKAEMANIAADTAAKVATKELTEEQAVHEIEKRLETIERRRGIKIDNDIKDALKYTTIERGKQPKNYIQLGYDGIQGAQNYFKKNVKYWIADPLKKYVIKPSKRLWKDTKRSLGIP